MSYEKQTSVKEGLDPPVTLYCRVTHSMVIQASCTAQAAYIILVKNKGNDGICFGLGMNRNAFNLFLNGPPVPFASSSHVHPRNGLFETDHPDDRLSTDRTLITAHNNPTNTTFASIMATWSENTTTLAMGMSRTTGRVSRIR